MKREFIIKYPKGYLQCDSLSTLQSGRLTPSPAQATVFPREVSAQQALDRFNRVFDKGVLLEGETVGHIIHQINLQEGNYVTCHSVSKLYGRD